MHGQPGQGEGIHRALEIWGRRWWLGVVIFLGVLVPGLTDVPAEMERVAAFGAELGVVQRAEILPFHQMGRYKWERLGLDYRQAETEPPTPEAVADAIALFQKAGLNAC